MLLWRLAHIALLCGMHNLLLARPRHLMHVQPNFTGGSILCGYACTINVQALDVELGPISCLLLQACCQPGALPMNVCTRLRDPTRQTL